jgi:uncharacterized protein YeaO (DUF488 family)
VLVDRLWPRGISKEKASLDEWAKDVAPSTELRVWFGHDPMKFSEFEGRYLKEIEQSGAAAATISNWRTHSKVTLLYAARDTTNNEAIVLQNLLENE